MNDDDRRLISLIRTTLAQQSAETDGTDLWPRLRHRLERGTGPERLDWLLLALVASLLAVFPETLMLVLYHL